MALGTRPVTEIGWALTTVNNGPTAGNNKVPYTTRHLNEGFNWKEKPPREYQNQWQYNMYTHVKFNGDSVIDLNTRLSTLESASAGAGNTLGLEDLGNVTGSVALDGTKAFHRMTATGALLLSPPSGITTDDKAGETHFIEITQDATGSRVLTLTNDFETQYKPVLSTGVGETDLIEIVWGADKWKVVEIKHNYLLSSIAPVEPVAGGGGGGGTTTSLSTVSQGGLYAFESTTGWSANAKCRSLSFIVPVGGMETGAIADSLHVYSNVFFPTIVQDHHVWLYASKTRTNTQHITDFTNLLTSLDSGGVFTNKEAYLNGFLDTSVAPVGSDALGTIGGEILAGPETNLYVTIMYTELVAGIFTLPASPVRAFLSVDRQSHLKDI